MVECNFRQDSVYEGQHTYYCMMKGAHFTSSGRTVCDEDDCIFVKMLEPVKERMEVAWNQVVISSLETEVERLTKENVRLNDELKRRKA